MEIIEQFTCSKSGDPSTNEDALWIGEWFCLVADGVTAKSNARWNSKTGGQIAVECVISAVMKLNGDESAREAFCRIQETIREYGLPDEIMPQASVLIYSHKRRELWSVGDCPYIINGIYYKNEKKVDLLLSELRKLNIESFLMDGHIKDELLEHDLARDMILPFLKLQSKFIDSDSAFSYSVVDGIHPINDLTIVSIPDGSELILATDGYPDLKTSLFESEESLAQILEEDPLCYCIFPSTKGIIGNNISFDDRTYLKILT